MRGEIKHAPMARHLVPNTAVTDKFCDVYELLHAMPPLELTTPRKMGEEYFGPNPDVEVARTKMDQRNQKQASKYSDQVFDTSLFPYEVEEPLATPLPTPAEIFATEDGHPSILYEQKYITLTCKVRMGPYMVKYARVPTIFKVFHAT